MTELRIGEDDARRRVLLGAALFAALTVTMLLWAKWWPYTERTATLAGSRQWQGSSLLQSAGAGPDLGAGWEFTLAYAEAVWPALLAALLIGAALDALLPHEWLTRSLNRRPALSGAALAVPSMMCTCCTAPIVNSMRRSGVSIRAAVAYWLGNPVLNPAVLVFLLLLAPWQWAATRLLVGTCLVFGAAALAGRLATRSSSARPVPVPPADPAATAPGPRFLRTLSRSALVLVPEYALVVFAVGALRGWLFPLDADLAEATLLAVVLAAVLGLLIVLPTGGEIPVLLGLTAVGFSPAVTGALLITLPAVSLPSIVMVARALSWRATTAVIVGVAGAGLLGALLLPALL